MSSLLRTKIQLPPLRSQYIRRERIRTQIEANLAARLVLISAPAGFGKSTALIQWAHRLQRDGTIIAWYALDERDNDPARFAAYLLEAFRTHSSIFSTLPDVTEKTTLAVVVDHILNIASTVETPLMLILDDYHLIEEPQIHDAIRQTCAHMPITMRLAIGSRSDPPLQLARMRVSGEICEIRMGDLRFSPGEMRDWVNRSLGWTPSLTSIDKLIQATEGWAAAIALILMNQPSADETTLATQLERYSQSQRHIFDYFAQEILNQQSTLIRDFLLQTCVLNQLKPDLCQTMTARNDAPLMLEQLARQSLFVIPLSEQEPIYRYHHLFADFLCQYLELADRARYLALHRQAAEWYANNDDIVEAVNHSFAAQDFDYAISLIEQEAGAALNTRGEFMTLVNWLPRIPQDSLKQHPGLWLNFVHALYLTGHIELAEKHLQQAVDTLNQYEDNSDSWKASRAIAYNHQATLAAYRGDMHLARNFNKLAYALRDWVELADRLEIGKRGAFIHYFTGNVSEARTAYQEALTLAEQLDQQYQMLDINFYLAQLDFLAGNLTAAQERCEQLLDWYSGHHQAVPIMLPLAKVHYQRNRVVEAEVLLRDVTRLARQANLPDSVFFANIALSDLLLSQGEIEQSAISLAQAHQFAQSYDSQMANSMLSAAEARYWLRSGQLDQAVDWATWYQQTESSGYIRDDEDLTLVQVWLAQSQFEPAVVVLQRIIDGAQANERTFYVIQAEILRASAYYAASRNPEAHEALDHALSLASPCGFVRIFIDAGRPIHTLLRQAAEQGNRYATNLMEIAATMERVQHPADVLTEREIEVLQHIADGASNQAIADSLVLSVGTIKSHIHHIMSKLDVKNRTEAVSKARSLNILSD